MKVQTQEEENATFIIYTCKNDAGLYKQTEQDCFGPSRR